MINTSPSRHSRIIGFIFSVVAILAPLVASQGDDCYCAPLQYSFQFDFSLECIDMGEAPGFLDTICIVSGINDGDVDVTNLVPVEVSDIKILELGPDFTAIGEAEQTGAFHDGDGFDYSSVLTGPDYVDIRPAALQITATGRNSDDQPIILHWAVLYSNSCDALPFVLNDSVGWTIYVSSHIVSIVEYVDE
jgi:hypothetical protein